MRGLKKRKVIGICNKDKDKWYEFDSVREASRQLNIRHTTIIASCDRMENASEQIYFNKYGWCFYYKEDEELAEARIRGEGIMAYYNKDCTNSWWY